MKPTKYSTAQSRMTEAEGEALARAWRESGLSMRAFGQKHGIPAHRVHYWNQRVQKGKTAGPKAGSFVVLAADGTAPAVDGDPGTFDDAIEICVGEEYFVRVPQRPGALAEVLKMLRGDNA